MSKWKIFLAIIFISSCNAKLTPGKYVDSDYGIITIDKSHNYKFKSPYPWWGSFSTGIVQIRHGTIIFTPDSSYIFQAQIKNSIYIKERGVHRTLILTDTFDLGHFGFYCELSNSYRLTFDSNYNCTIPDSVDLTNFRIVSKLKSAESLAETPRNNFLESNILYSPDEEWNNLYLKIKINYKMFDFKVMEDMFLYKNSLHPIRPGFEKKDSVRKK